MIEVLVGDHLVLEADEDLFHVVFTLPVRENVELRGLNLAIALVHAWHVDLGTERDLGGLRRVVRTASNGQEVDAVVIFGVRRSNDSALPLSECSVIT